MRSVDERDIVMRQKYFFIDAFQIPFGNLHGKRDRSLWPDNRFICILCACLTHLRYADSGQREECSSSEPYRPCPPSELESTLCHTAPAEIGSPDSIGSPRRRRVGTTTLIEARRDGHDVTRAGRIDSAVSSVLRSSVMSLTCGRAEPLRQGAGASKASRRVTCERCDGHLKPGGQQRIGCSSLKRRRPAFGGCRLGFHKRRHSGADLWCAHTAVG